jgi:hypothetical protein
MLIPKWKRNIFDIAEDIIVTVAIIVVGDILFEKCTLSEGRYSIDIPENIDNAFIMEKAVNAQKIFLKGDVIAFLVFHKRKKEIIRKIKP